MKPALFTLFFTVIVGHTFGYYVPTNINEYYTGSCGCAPAKLSDFEYNIDSPSPSTEESTDVKYKFDFNVEQPKAAANSEAELKSYGYAIQVPASDSKPDDTKYKFDYALQRPAEEKSDEPEQRTMYTKVDRVTQDKHECACKQGKPCSCGYSPEQCAIHCTERNTNPYTSGYVLPVRYNDGGDYVVYELPQDATTIQQLSRTARQVSPSSPQLPQLPQLPQMPQLPQFPPATDAIQSLINGDRFRAHADRFRETFSRLTGGGGAAAGDDSGDTKLGASLDISSLRDRFSSMAEPFVSHATKVVENFTQNFGLPVSTRRRRAASMTKDERSEMDKRIPMLRVKEYEANRGKNDDISKYTTASRVELKFRDQQENCHKCGSKMTDTVCKQCGNHQQSTHQYVEFIDGRPISFYPRAQRSQMNTESRPAPRYIFDRYGHKYLENNGNLRLIRDIVEEQPDFAGLADILESNKEAIQQFNPAPGRIMPEPIDIASDAIDLVRDLALRKIKRADNDKPEKRSTSEYPTEEKTQKAEEQYLPRSMYQVLPMHYDGKDGKLVVKVFSKNDKTSSEVRNDEATAAAIAAAKQHDTNMSDKSKPTVRKFNRDNKEFEILSFEDYKNSSNEDIRQVLEHLHSKQLQ